MPRFAALSLLALLAVPIGCGKNNSPGAGDVITAVGGGDTSRLAELLKSGAPVDAKDARGFTALSLAAFNGDVNSIQLLLDRGAKTDAGDDQASPLRLAAKAGHLQVVNLLLSKGVSPNPESGKPSILGEAKNAKIAEALIKAGARVNWVGGDVLNSPLHEAASLGNVEVVEVLLKAGGDPNKGNMRSQTPLHHAAFGRWAGSSADAESKMLATVVALLKAGANPNLTDVRQSLPLHYAARNPLSTPEMINALVNAGSRVAFRNMSNATPLELARQSNRPETDPVVQLLAKLEKEKGPKEPKSKLAAANPPIKFAASDRIGRVKTQ